MENQANQPQPGSEQEPALPATTQEANPATQPFDAPTVIQQNSQQLPAKAKPPLAVQILFALGLCGLIIGIFTAALLLNSSSGASSSVLVFNGMSNTLAATILASAYVFLFVLINYIRALKLWALITYTSAMSLLFTVTLYGYLTRSELEKLLDNTSFVGTFLVYIIVAPLLLVIWAKNRKQFS